MKRLQKSFFGHPREPFQPLSKPKQPPIFPKYLLCVFVSATSYRAISALFTGPKQLHSKGAELAPKIVLYFTQRNGPILRTKIDLFYLQCIYRILTVSHFLFTCYLQNLDSLLFSIYMLFTES